MTNPFLHPLYELRFGGYPPSEAIAALEHTEREARRELEKTKALRPGERTFDNTVLAISRAARWFESVAGIIAHHESVLGEPWHEPNERMVELASQLGSDMAFDRELYAALIEVESDTTVTTALSPARHKLLRHMIRQFERDGIALAEPEQMRLREIRAAIAEASRVFAENVVEATDAAGLHLGEAMELTGLDEAFVESCRTAAVARGEDGFWLAFNIPDYVTVMSTCSHRETRRRLYEVSITRAGAANASVVRQVVALRQEMAGILGYADYADYTLEDRMAGTGERARAFIEDLRGRYEPKAAAETAALRDFARALEHDPALELGPEDLDTGLQFYYASHKRAQEVGLDESALRDYFAIDHVREVMFETLGELYGVRFEPADEPGWSAGVESYRITGANGRHLSTVWCDWFARTGKRGGAWMDCHYIADRAPGADWLPHLGYVVCNFESPRDGAPARLTMEDVETIWHEFGHFMHQTLSAPELIEHSAMATRWDFVEAPSQIMENWVWSPVILGRLARHHVTGAGLPPDVLQKLLASRTYNVGLGAMRQLALSAVDLALHQTDRGGTDPVGAAHLIKAAYLPVPVHPLDATLMTFGHIIDGGYESAYYSYKWAESIEVDLFSRFESEGVTNRATGLSYRDQVLRPGAELEPDELIRGFLGRPTSPDAMLRRDGVA